MQLKHEPVKYYSHYFCLTGVIEVYCSTANCLNTVHSILAHTKNWKTNGPSQFFVLTFFKHFMTKACRHLGRPSVQSQSMLVGASRVLCCVVNIYGMQQLS